MKRIVLSVFGSVILLGGVIIPFRLSSANNVGNILEASPTMITSDQPAGTKDVLVANPEPTVPVIMPAIEAAVLNAETIANDNPPVPNVKANQDTQGNTTMFKSKPYDQINSGPYTMMNNLWGAPKNESLSSTIFQAPDGSFGWSWSRISPVINSGQSNVQPIYPSIRIGGNRWERTKSEYFPVAVKDLNFLNLDIAYNYLEMPTGSFDLSYDLFLSDPNQPDNSPQIAAEVMIWLQGTSKQPEKYYKGDISDGANTFALYSWTMSDGRQYYSFLLKGQLRSQAQYSINAKALLDQLKLDSKLLIHGMEFGNEVWNGTGQIQITHFEINLNSQQIKAS